MSLFWEIQGIELLLLGLVDSVFQRSQVMLYSCFILGSEVAQKDPQPFLLAVASPRGMEDQSMIRVEDFVVTVEDFALELEWQLKSEQQPL